MSSGAIAQLMGFITVPDYKTFSHDNSLLKFRLAFSKYDFSNKKTVTDFLTVTAFGKMADRIHSDIQNNLNYICCFCDVRVSKYTSKAGSQAEHTEFIINNFRAFLKPKTENSEQDDSNKAEDRNEHKNSHHSVEANDGNFQTKRFQQKSFFGVSDDLQY